MKKLKLYILEKSSDNLSFILFDFIGFDIKLIAFRILVVGVFDFGNLVFGIFTFGDLAFGILGFGFLAFGISDSVF